MRSYSRLEPRGHESLEQRLEAAAETQSFEVKAAMAWDEESLARDIMVLSNVRDGGVIVIGIEDITFARQGVDAATRATYDVDVMRDQMTKYADPHVDFTVSFPTDIDGKTFFGWSDHGERNDPYVRPRLRSA